MVIRLRIMGVRVSATRIKITATTVEVKSFLRWANKPVILMAVNRSPPKKIEVYTASRLLFPPAAIPTKKTVAGPMIIGRRCPQITCENKATATTKKSL